MSPAHDKTFIEWSHKVLEELVTLNARLDVMEEKRELFETGVRERFSQIDAKLAKIDAHIVGNGHPGLLTRVDRIEQKNIDDLDIRVDRIEQSEKRRVWVVRSCIVTCLACIGAVIAEWVKGRA